MESCRPSTTRPFRLPVHMFGGGRPLPAQFHFTPSPASVNCGYELSPTDLLYPHKFPSDVCWCCPSHSRSIPASNGSAKIATPTMASRAALVDAVSTLLNAEYSVFAMFAFVSYDWLINLDKEIHYFWDYREGRKVTAAALLYGLSRYPAIIGMVLQLQTAFPLSDMVSIFCQINNHLQAAANIPYALAPALFSAIRVYALAPNNKAVAISTFLLLFVPTFIITIINAMDKAAPQPSPFNCGVLKTPISHQVADR
ncbi:hypothetical protein LXA43DRAFT_756087 [Ganoderma leucocontextum]|nr:hypothetical protein LXA43DRAFT_756087 [Ganoderma leucocontextum]